MYTLLLHAGGKSGEVTILLRCQLGEVTCLDNLAILEDSNARTFLYGSQTVGYHNRGSVHHHILEGLLDLALRNFIESACCFIKKQNLGVSNDSSCDGDTLFLAS